MATRLVAIGGRGQDTALMRHRAVELLELLDGDGGAVLVVEGGVLRSNHGEVI